MATKFGPDLLLLERIASGGMGEVFRALQVGAGGFRKTVAVKRILPHFAASEEFRTLFEQEMRLCANMQHPNIVAIYRNGEESGYLYLVMEFVDGQSFEKVIKYASGLDMLTPVPIACYLASEASRGLHYAHSLTDESTGAPLNLVHRDVSPQNLLVSYRGEVKVTDFGIAKAAGQTQLTRTGEIKGKVGYVAPEYLQGQVPDRRSDVYSLGVVLYELLSGSRLFAGDSTFQIVTRIMEAKVPSLTEVNPEVPEALSQIVARAISRDPAERFQTAEDLGVALRSFLLAEYPDFQQSICEVFLERIFHRQIASDRDQRRSESQIIKAAALLGESASTGSSATAVVLANQDPEEVSSARRRLKRSTHITLGLLIGINCILLFALLNMKDSTPAVPETPQAEVTAPVTIAPQAPVRTARTVVAPPRLLANFEASSLAPGHVPGVVIDRPVSRWYGGSNIEAIQRNEARMPRLTLDSRGRFPVVTFDGVDDFLTADMLAQAQRRSSGITAFFVARAGSVLGKTSVWAIHASDHEGDIARGGFIDKALRIKTTRAIYEYFDSPSLDFLQPTLVSVVVDSNRARGFRNGSLIVDRTFREEILWDDARYFSIGQEWDGNTPSDFFLGEIYELRIYSGPLPDSARETIERELTEKYAL